jgi:hypothetical protein
VTPSATANGNARDKEALMAHLEASLVPGMV